MSTEPMNSEAPPAVVAASEPEKAPEKAPEPANTGTTSAQQPEAAKPSEAGAEPAGADATNATKAANGADTTNAASAAPAKPKEELTDEDIKLLPIRQYLEQTVVGVIMQGMQQICRKRPEDPVSFLSDFLLKNNPRKRKAEDDVGDDVGEEPGTQAAPAATPVEQA